MVAAKREHEQRVGRCQYLARHVRMRGVGRRRYRDGDLTGHDDIVELFLPPHFDDDAIVAGLREERAVPAAQQRKRVRYRRARL